MTSPPDCLSRRRILHMSIGQAWICISVEQYAAQIWLSGRDVDLWPSPLMSVMQDCSFIFFLMLADRLDIGIFNSFKDLTLHNLMENNVTQLVCNQSKTCRLSFKSARNQSRYYTYLPVATGTATATIQDVKIIHPVSSCK